MCVYIYRARETCITRILSYPSAKLDVEMSRKCDLRLRSRPLTCFQRVDPASFLRCFLFASGDQHWELLTRFCTRI